MPNEMLQYLSKVTIIRSLDPKRDKMRYRNLITNERVILVKNILLEGVSIFIRGKGLNGRIIIGPKDFDRHLPWDFSLSSCSLEDLEAEVARTYPSEKIKEMESLLLLENKPLVEIAKKALPIPSIPLTDIYRGIYKKTEGEENK